MTINEDYKKIQCIEKMPSEYKERFFKIVDQYAPKLLMQITLEGSTYTLHDFNHHCINIYRCISGLILNGDLAYGENGLTPKELYILNLAVLFHDIGMTAFPDSRRDNHSKLSAEKIEELYENEESIYAQNVNLSNTENDALKAIIMAHSDVKDGSIEYKFRGLNDPNLSNNMCEWSGRIRGKFLASVLRLADEMDVTKDRIGQTSIETYLKRIRIKLNDIKNNYVSDNMEINQGIKYDIDKLEKVTESIEHWKKLHLFSGLDRKSACDEAFLRVDDAYVRRCIDGGETYESIGDNIVTVWQKISDELNKGLKQIIQCDDETVVLKNLIVIDKITLSTNIEELKNEIQKRLNGGANSKVEKKMKNHEMPELLNDDFSAILEKEVWKRHLIKVGHFILNGTFCARDWIDTKEIVETKSLIEEMTFCITDRLRNDYEKEEDLFDQCLVVGLDYEGAVIAARVGMILQMAFSYIIPTKNLDFNANKEKEVQFGKYHRIILVTDAIVTYETIKTSLQYIGIPKEDYGKIEKIFTIFYRDSAYQQQIDNKILFEKTYSLCNAFNIELFEKKNCIYAKHGCLAENNR